MSQRPVVVGLFTCEQVIIEENSRNVTTVNCFTQRIVERFPSEVFPFVVFAILTDGLGEMPLILTIYRLDNLEEIYSRSLSLRFANPLQEARCIIRIPDCSFPVHGHYQLTLTTENELLAHRKIRVIGKENPK
jgi:hypothetical protein